MAFSTTDILRIAECVEGRVADFYRRMANRASCDSVHDLCLSLAEQNGRHARYWHRTRLGLCSPSRPYAAGKNDAEDVFQPESMAGLTWLGNPSGEEERFAGRESPERLLRDAQRRIRVLVTFYEGLKGFVMDEAALAMVHRLVRMSQQQDLAIRQRLETLTLLHNTPTG
jgi:rubrerythrin